MSKNTDIAMLTETLAILEKGNYEKNGLRVRLQSSPKDMRSAHVFLPDEVERLSHDPEFKVPYRSYGFRCRFRCENKDSFDAARECAKADGKMPVLVLNFANPVHPGGGVRSGARAQEEDLCRRSSLLLSLEGGAARRYYQYNRGLATRLGSDAIIISPSVEVFRGSDGELFDEPFVCAVMTCAAPMISNGKEGLSDEEYETLLLKRMEGMLKCAARLGYRRLVLGAWGCGAFGNDARIVSDLFYHALKGLDYNGAGVSDLFNSIDFAVLSRSRKQYNFREFERNFTQDAFYREENRAEEEAVAARIRERERNLDKVRGCLVGGAVGDALGYAVEFCGEGQIFERYGKRGITSYELDPASGKALISDDTQMTLFTATGILVGQTRGALRGIMAAPRAYVMGAYQDWLRTQEISWEEHTRGKRKDTAYSWLSDVPELYSRRAPGNTCLSALKRRRAAQDDIDDYASAHLNDSKGCGGVMRVAPMGLAWPGGNQDDIDREAAQIAALTHGHSLGFMTAAMLAHIVSRLVFGKGRVLLEDVVVESRDAIVRLFSGDAHLGELTAIIDLAIELSHNDKADLENIHRLGEGWVAEETLAIAVYCALRHQTDFSSGVIAAVNHAGDSDSTGAVCGNILGALLGYGAIGERWTRDLELHDVIVEVADDLCRGCQMSDAGRYYDPAWDSKYVWCRRYDGEKRSSTEGTRSPIVERQAEVVVDDAEQPTQCGMAGLGERADTCWARHRKSDGDSMPARDFFDAEEYAFLEETAAGKGGWAERVGAAGLAAELAGRVLEGDAAAFEGALEREDAAVRALLGDGEFLRLVLLGLSFGVELGDAACANYLGALYYMGEGVPRDYARAEELYRLADAKGLVQAMVNLGYIYEYGRTGKPDCLRAYMQYAKAAAVAGHPEALYKLGDMYARGRVGERDPRTALALYERSLEAAKGVAAQAQPAFRIAELVSDPGNREHGIPYDPMGALGLYQLAERGLRVDIARGQTYYRARLAQAIEGQERVRAVLDDPGFRM